MLLLLNGAPGVGKSTLAQRYVDNHALALIVDVDDLRRHLGQWQQREESRIVARGLARALARAHLAAGHHVVIPQLVARHEFRETLRELTSRFHEVVLTDDADAMIGRFVERRRAYAAAGIRHPEGDLADDAVASEISAVDEQLRVDAALRNVTVISMRDGIDAAYGALLADLRRVATP